MLQKNKIHRHKEDIQKRIQNIQKKIQSNLGMGSIPSTAIATNRRQLMFNHDKYANRSAFQPDASTGIDGGENDKRELVGARRTFSYAGQDYQTGHVLKQRYQRADIQDNRRQRQMRGAGEDVKQKSNKYLSQYLTIIEPQNKSYGRISANRKNSSQNFGQIVSNKQNSKNLQENISLKRVSVQKQTKNNQNIYYNRQIDQAQIVPPNELRKNIELEQILKEVVSNQRKLQNQVLQLKTQLVKQNQFKQTSMNTMTKNHYKSYNNRNNESLDYGRDRNPEKQNEYLNTKTMKLTDYHVSQDKSLNKKKLEQMSHDPYMITNNMTNPTLSNDAEYNYDRVVKIIKQKQHRKRKISEKQNMIKIQDEQNLSDCKSQPKKHLQINPNTVKDKLKKNTLKQKLYSIVKVGKPNTERYIVPDSNKQIFYEHLKSRMEQAELEYTDIMHRNNRFQHERLISANELQKKIRDNALAIIYQQCNKCVYK